LLGEEWNRWERWTSGIVAKSSWRKNKKGDDIELRRFWVKGSTFMADAGCNGHLTSRVSGVDNTELDNG
jgi:hypothetical protein